MNASKKLREHIAKLADINVVPGLWEGLLKRIQAIQNAIKSLARGDNIQVGEGLIKTQINAHTIQISEKKRPPKEDSRILPLLVEDVPPKESDGQGSRRVEVRYGTVNGFVPTELDPTAANTFSLAMDSGDDVRIYAHGVTDNLAADLLTEAHIVSSPADSPLTNDAFGTDGSVPPNLYHELARVIYDATDGLSIHNNGVGNVEFMAYVSNYFNSDAGLRVSQRITVQRSGAAS